MSSLVELIYFLIQTSLLSTEGEGILCWVEWTEIIPTQLIFRWDSSLPKIWRQNIIRKLIIILRESVPCSIFAIIQYPIRKLSRFKWTNSKLTSAVHMPKRTKVSRKEILIERYPILILVIHTDIAHFLIITGLSIFSSFNSCSLHEFLVLLYGSLNIGCSYFIIGDHIRPILRKSKRSLKFF